MPRNGANVQRGDQSRSLQGLHVALEHPKLSTYPRVLCAAARACRAWREAVQQCAACNTVIVLNPQTTLPQLCGFAQWLPKHAALVKSVTATAIADRLLDVHGLEWRAHWEVAQQLLQHGLQAAAPPPQTALGAAAAAPGLAPVIANSHNAAATAGQQQQQRLQGLRLTSFSSNFAGTAGVVAALPAHSLTSLHLEYNEGMPPAGPGLPAGLACLTGLQHVHHNNRCQRQPLVRKPPVLPGGCVAALSALRQLTYLSLRSYWHDAQQQLQQLMEAAPPLQCLHLGNSVDASDEALDMRPLTRLTELTASQLPHESLLPAQLQRLCLKSVEIPVGLACVLPLQQLQHLSLGVGGDEGPTEPTPLLPLAQLPALTQLELSYTWFTDATATAAAWPQLPQLRVLDLDTEGNPPSAELAGVLASIGGCSGLTRLRLVLHAEDVELPEDLEPGQQYAGIAACGSLAALTGLRDLMLHSHQLAPGDTLALSKLTALTRLDLAELAQGVDDVAATALACCCRQLRHLDLRGCDLGSMACLAVIGQLPQLTELHLDGTPITRRGLRLLTGLSYLRQLRVTFSAGVTASVWDRFWATMPKQVLTADVAA
uniref:F-box domain-containing protein n=1 Tax=Tetradesmus obliquus TaxID=3088 RepID=A0A383WM33_TETOB|eukprot:jgi/Sobl393_1/12367/SZX78229.1